MPLTTVNSPGILDGTITNADISTNAAIDASKISGLNLGELETDQTISANKTFAGANKNYGLMGPTITVAAGITLQVTDQTSVLTII
tara:strand:+ start:119 stop:379 length:261 start_codon:yes stop_codon:yes gene_type:complete